MEDVALKFIYLMIFCLLKKC